MAASGGNAAGWGAGLQGAGSKPDFGAIYNQAAAQAPGGPSAWNGFVSGTAPNPYAAAAGSAANPALPQLPDDYLAAYRASFANARQGVDQQFQTALQDLSGREQLSQNVANSLPGRFSAIYDPANAALAQRAQTNLAAEQGQNVQTFAPAVDNSVQAMQAANVGAAASRQADVPLVQAGVTAAANLQRGALGQARLGALADVNSQETQANIQAARDRYQAQVAQQTAAQQHQYDLQTLQQQQTGAGAQPTFAEQNQATRDNATFQAQLQQKTDAQARQVQAQAHLQSFGGGNDSPQRGQAIQVADPARFRAIQNSPAYKSAIKSIGSKYYPNSTLKSIFSLDNSAKQRTWQQAVQALSKAGHHEAAAALASQYGG